MVLAFVFVLGSELLPNSNAGVSQSYVGCYQDKLSIQCSNFPLSELVEYLFSAPLILFLGTIHGFGVLFVEGSLDVTEPNSIILITGYALLAMIINVLAAAYLISLIRKLLPIRNAFQKPLVSGERNGWEYTTAKILILLLIVVAVGRMTVLRPVHKYIDRTPLTVSATIGKAPFTVHITGPEHFLALKNTSYDGDVDTHLDGESCGFSVWWFGPKTPNHVIPRDHKEQGCAAFFSQTFTEPGQYSVSAVMYESIFRTSGQQERSNTWVGGKVDILVE